MPGREVAAPSFPPTSRGSGDAGESGAHSILVHEGRPRRAETEQSIHFSDRQETFSIPNPAEEDLPEFCDEEEKERAIAAAKKLAEEALADESEGVADQVIPQTPRSSQNILTRFLYALFPSVCTVGAPVSTSAFFHMQRTFETLHTQIYIKASSCRFYV